MTTISCPGIYISQDSFSPAPPSFSIRSANDFYISCKNFIIMYFHERDYSRNEIHIAEIHVLKT
jgi:hypothetical protein